jgi:hypothetical protein
MKLIGAGRPFCGLGARIPPRELGLARAHDRLDAQERVQGASQEEATPAWRGPDEHRQGRDRGGGPSGLR